MHVVGFFVCFYECYRLLVAQPELALTGGHQLAHAGRSTESSPSQGGHQFNESDEHP